MAARDGVDCVRQINDDASDEDAQPTKKLPPSTHNQYHVGGEVTRFCDQMDIVMGKTG